ncbi:hypothetical protein J2T08_000539 [Neorhizobium galegae]|uniref:hypothetical protein n=1 Tax=Neorhizobium galegae TaxID=399 RepID=UPI0027889D90|nr:hypothetical protein [Neorhizobium galegae]MDQ0132638.1 hypothetical protein [Neorhizobium galegae]
MGAALRRLPRCPECESVLNAGLICEFCGTAPTQTDLDCQMAIEHVTGAVILARPETLNPSRIWSDGNVRTFSRGHGR